MTPSRAAVSPPSSPLAYEAAQGDLVAARNFADRMLLDADVANEPRDARLLLTAACLHLDSRPGPEATLSDLMHILVRASQSIDALDFLRTSPMQFLQFAWLELQSLGPAVASLAIEPALRAVTYRAAVFDKMTA